MAATKYRIEIVYCPKCNWMLRSAWFAQELLYTFGEQIREMVLIPDSETAGRFEIRAEQTLLWERKRDGGFPEIKALKQKVRDIIEPERDLGHLENKP